MKHMGKQGIKLQLLSIFAATFIGAAVAHANSVAFSTSGSFNSSGNSIMFGSGANTLTVDFTGVNTVALNDTPFTFSSLGQFQTSTTGTGASITSGTSFTLTIMQTQPITGSADLFASLQGTLSQNQSTSLVTFSITSVTIGADTYAITNNPLPLVPPSTNDGKTSIQARISGPATVPEGGQTALLLGAALVGLFGVRGIWKPAFPA
jgi:hypothetical protein